MQNPADQENLPVLGPKLDENILKVLGEVQENKIAGENIHNDLAIRWEMVLKMGLNAEQRVSLIKKYPSINNCKMVEAPKLNSQVTASLNEVCRRRDN